MHCFDFFCQKEKKNSEKMAYENSFFLKKKNMCEKMYMQKLKKEAQQNYNQNSIILLYLAIKYNQKITTIIVLHVHL